MILKSIFGFVVLVVAYSLLVSRLAESPAWSDVEGQDQWQDNVIRAQRFVYSKKNYKAVIVGSSVGARLLTRLFPDGFYNLSMSGGSVLTGLEIVARYASSSPQTPTLVLVETNGLRKPDTRLLDSLAHPIGRRLRQWLPILREEYQPATVLGQALRRGFSAGGTGYRLPETTFSKVVEGHKKDYSISSDELGEAPLIARMAELVRILQKKNFKVAFFEMPVHRDLANSVLADSRRARLFATFPKSDFIWIERPKDEEYETSDGLHLLDPSVRKFIAEILQAISKFVPVLAEAR